MARRIQTTLLSPLGAIPAAPAPQFAAKPLLTDVLSAKYGVPPEQQNQPPDSAFKPHTQYNSPYEDQGLKELAEKIMANKAKQGKRWRKMIKRIKKREKASLGKTKSSKKVIPASLEPKKTKKKAVAKKPKGPPPSMAKCHDLKPVVTQVKGHKRQTYVCLDKPPAKDKKKKKTTKKKKQQDGTKKSKTKKQQGSKKKTKKTKVAEPTFEPEPLDDIERIRDFKARPARKFASTWPGFF